MSDDDVMNVTDVTGDVVRVRTATMARLLCEVARLRAKANRNVSTPACECKVLCDEDGEPVPVVPLYRH